MKEEKAIRAVIDKLNEIAEDCLEYVGRTDDPTSIVLDGYFNIQELIQIALRAAQDEG